MPIHFPIEYKESFHVVPVIVKDGDSRYYVENGERILLGAYTKEIRDHYIAYRVARYLIDHPSKTKSEANKKARAAWRKKVTKRN